MWPFIFWFLVFVTVLVCAWVLWVRPRICEKPWAQPFFHAIEPIEMLWSKSETILWARFLQAMGLASVGLTYLSGFDPMQFVFLVQEEYRWALVAIPAAAVFLNGMITKRLRESTTKPLEVVAIPMDAPIEVKEAAVRAEVANDTAKAAATDLAKAA